MPPSKPRRSPKPQERRRDPERTRKLILDAAEAEFAAHGYAGARTGAIAERAGVNQQLIWYYFDSKDGLAKAISQRWRQRQEELVTPGTPLPEQLRRYALEAVENPDAVRLFAWAGLEYTGPESDLDQESRTAHLRETVDELRSRLPADLDPAAVMIMLMAAAMAPTTLPHVIEGVSGVDPRSPEFVRHYADQLALLVKHLGFPD